jgi:hypothetical protein
VTTTHSHHPRARRRLDVAGALVLLCGLFFGALAYWLIQERGFNALILVPAIVAVTLGSMHLWKWDAPRS